MIHLKKVWDIPANDMVLTVVVCDKHSDLEHTDIGKSFNIKKSDDSMSATTYWVYEPNTVSRVLLVFRKEYLCTSTVVHECFHAVHRISDHLQTNLCDGTQELFACSVGFLSAKVFRELRKAKIRWSDL